jgi:hypothetical protein
MLDDVRDVDPAAYASVPIERVVSQITKWGKVEAEFCCTTPGGLFMTYYPHLSTKSLKFGVGGGPYDLVLAAACWATLRQWSRAFVTEQERMAWAVKHRWPKAELFAPIPFEQPAATPTDEATILKAVSEGGKYDPRLAFLFNRAVVVWHPGQREYRFPDIPDHPTANACRDYLRRRALALVDLPGQQPADHPDPFPILIEHASTHGWPELDALSARANMWRSFRSK